MKKRKKKQSRNAPDTWYIYTECSFKHKNNLLLLKLEDPLAFFIVAAEGRSRDYISCKVLEFRPDIQFT